MHMCGLHLLWRRVHHQVAVHVYDLRTTDGTLTAQTQLAQLPARPAGGALYKTEH